MNITVLRRLRRPVAELVAEDRDEFKRIDASLRETQGVVGN